MTLPPVTAKRVELAANRLANTSAAATACREAGLPFYVACALLEKESGGMNAWGNDKGGVFAELPSSIPVTRDGYRIFRYKVFDLGELSNGVGPCQITSRGLLRQMESDNLKPWVPVDNMRFGFKLLAGYYTRTKAWTKAGTLYNEGNLNSGVTDYGRDLSRRVASWKKLLGI